MSSPVIRVVDLWKIYEDGTEGSTALRGTSMEITRGEVLALLGKSGSGKTTLLNLLAGLDRPSRGFIEVEGKNLQNLGDKGRTLLRRRRLGFIFQFFNLLPTLTAFENVYLALELAGKGTPAQVFAVLAEVGLKGKEKRYPHELSGGEQQRVAIARAIVKEPALILADEPTGNLDTATGMQILELLSSRCRESGMSLLMVTHTPMARRFADRVLHMVDGVIRPEADGEEPGP
ncbi:putative ABC transport system ATP-binding protein [Syntrophus gentianae]|uniref:Putative ABC transport system ATP-binding protein n=1 Tax=Syntrophus gentianae TaxID=43775 RepID=A0A1H7Y6J1_9BACT|nr:putative ABC transport system ATP-binding protein [Syntrophus gentianae]